MSNSRNRTKIFFDISKKFLLCIFCAADGPDGTCDSLTCHNGGHCVMKRVHQTRVAACDCELTTFTGHNCDSGEYCTHEDALRDILELLDTGISQQIIATKIFKIWGPCNSEIFDFTQIFIDFSIYFTGNTK